MLVDVKILHSVKKNFSMYLHKLWGSTSLVRLYILERRERYERVKKFFNVKQLSKKIFSVVFPSEERLGLPLQKKYKKITELTK